MNYVPGITEECSPSASHSRRGILSTANGLLPDTDTTQRFITYGAQTHLDGSHTVFGELVDEQASNDALDALEARSSAGGTPTETLTIISATITIE